MISNEAQLDLLMQDGSYKWNGEMPQAAETIIHQHAIQGDITQVQQSVWYVFAEVLAQFN